MKPQIRTIIIEVRRPQTEEERTAFGCTYNHGNVSRVFIDSRLSVNFAKIFFHEMFHVYVNFWKRGRVKDEEEKCEYVGEASKEALNGRS